MSYKYRTCILLTACVNPNGMSETVLQNSEERAEQYRHAIDFYIKETNLPIVFCENTMYDMKSDYEQHIISGRMEYLMFDGNNYDKKRGKGYGEARIMKYAISHSDIIKQSKYIIKITGRLVITNIMRIASSPLLYFGNIFRSNIVTRYIQLYIFIARPELVWKIVVKYQEEITDYPKGSQIENHFYTALTQDCEFCKTLFVPFLRVPQIIGVSGTSGHPYSVKYVHSDNLACTGLFHFDRKHKIISYPLGGAFYLVYLFENKIKHYLGKIKL